MASLNDASDSLANQAAHGSILTRGKDLKPALEVVIKLDCDSHVVHWRFPFKSKAASPARR
jgi:hypothetical protein